MSYLAIICAAVVAVMSSVALCWATPLSNPEAKPILEIGGTIGVTNRDGAAVFDRAMLESLGMETITTTTPWHKGQVTFEGVAMTKVMDLVGAKGKTVKALALNDYATQIPMEDFAKFGVILALKRDGEYMPVRDKGPLFIVYPYDSKTELRSQSYYGRSAWQLKRLEVTE